MKLEIPMQYPASNHWKTDWLGKQLPQNITLSCKLLLQLPSNSKWKLLNFIQYSRAIEAPTQQTAYGPTAGLRHWPNIKTTVCQRLTLAGQSLMGNFHPLRSGSKAQLHCSEWKFKLENLALEVHFMNFNGFFNMLNTSFKIWIKIMLFNFTCICFFLRCHMFDTNIRQQVTAAD